VARQPQIAASYWSNAEVASVLRQSFQQATGCLKNDRVTPPPISSGSRFRNRILDLNQIKSPCVQTIVLVVQALQRISRRRPQTGKAFGVCFGRLLREACV
jgi:hypothetical protein